MPIVNTRGAASAKAFGFLSKSVLAIDYLVVAGGAGGSANNAGGTASPAQYSIGGGAGGKAVTLNGKTITWVSGNTTRVYGAVA